MKFRSCWRRSRRVAAWTSAAFACLILMTMTPPLPAAEAPKPLSLPADQLISRVLTSRDTSYVGRRTSIFWAKGKTRAVVVNIWKDGDRVRYEYPASTGSRPMIVVETPTTLYVIHPRTKRGTVAQRSYDPGQDEIYLGLALANYRWEYQRSSGKEEKLKVVSAYRKEKAHPSGRFWIDPVHMAIVRSERYDPSGELRSSWTLDQVRYVDSLPDKLFEPLGDKTLQLREETLPTRITLSSSLEKAGFSAVPLMGVPDGFQLIEVMLEKVRDRLAVRLIYSDGLETFSLLETPRNPKFQFSLARSRKSRILGRPVQVVSSAEVNLVHWQDEKLHFVLTGSQPESQLLSLSRAMIASSHPPPHSPSSRGRSLSQVVRRGWQRLLNLLGSVWSHFLYLVGMA